jgi:proline iminopeptidase
MKAWERLAFPVYTRKNREPEAVQRGIRRPDVNLWFARPGGEGRTSNFFPALSRIECPTLVLGGEDDPMIPIECQEDIVAALPPHLVRFERFPNCGHSIIADAPQRAFAVIRSFIGHRCG